MERKTPSAKNWHRLNNGTMLPGLINAPQGGEYFLLDPKAVPGSTLLYRIVEEEIWNTRKIYGPWQITLPKSPLSQMQQIPSLAGVSTKKGK